MYVYYQTLNNSDISTGQYIANTLGFNEEEWIDDIIQKNNLEEAVACLGDFPDLLVAYILLKTDLSLNIAQTISIVSFHGLKGYTGRIDYHHFLTFEQMQDEISFLNNITTITDKNNIEIKGVIKNNYQNIIIKRRTETRQTDGTVITQVSYKKVETDKRGYFKSKFILQNSSTTTLTFIGINPINECRTKETEITISQSSFPKNFEILIAELLSSKIEFQNQLKTNEFQLKYLTKRLEKNLLKYFTEDEKTGFDILRDKIEKAPHPLLKKIYESIQSKFILIANDIYPDLNPGENILFYQKYTLYEMKRIQAEGLPGIIVALEQGLGKTFIGLSYIRNNAYGALIIARKNVVNVWGVQESKFFKESKLTVIDGINSRKKIESIKNCLDSLKVLNLEFIRVQDNRFNEMNKNENQFLIFDDGQFIGRESSNQTQGAYKLKGYPIILSATPFTTINHMRAVLNFIYRNDRAFKQTKVFSQIFDNSNPNSYKFLHFYFDRFVIRIKESDVFQKQNPKEELKENRLPDEIFVDPDEFGNCELVDEQSDSILKILTDRKNWKIEQQKRMFPTNNINDSYLSGKHEIERVRSDTGYIGSTVESPMYKEIDKILKREIGKLNGKVGIFCKSKMNVNNLYLRLKKFGYGVVTYYSDTAKIENIKTNGKYLTDDKENILYFEKKNKFEYKAGNDGKPVITKDTSKGSPITPLDYNLFLIQNDPKTNICIFTEQSGALGITATGLDALIDADPSDDYSIAYQKYKRILRLDNDHLKYNVRYYRIISHYSKKFLTKVKQRSLVKDTQLNHNVIFNNSDIPAEYKNNQRYEIINLYEKYFKHGTYDECQFDKLEKQKIIFEMVLEGFPEPFQSMLLSQENLQNFNIEDEYINLNIKNNHNDNTSIQPSNKDISIAA